VQTLPFWRRNRALYRNTFTIDAECCAQADLPHTRGHVEVRQRNTPHPLFSLSYSHNAAGQATRIGA